MRRNLDRKRKERLTAIFEKFLSLHVTLNETSSNLGLASYLVGEAWNPSYYNLGKI